MLAKIFFKTIFAFALGGAITVSVSLAAQAPETISEEKTNAGKVAGETWLGLIDQGKYGEAWDGGSNILRLTMNRDEWTSYLQKTRNPLGKLSNRNIVDIRTTKNPQGLPAAEYLVLIYKTSFGNKSGQELLILIQESDGQWRPMSYFVKSE